MSNEGHTQLFIDEVQGHQRRYLKLLEFTQSTTKAAGVMLVAAIVALVIANSPVYPAFLEFWHTKVSLGFGSATGSMTLSHIINDVFMAIFFLLVGLEIKYEMTVGELTNVRQALLPILAACGGVIMPCLVFCMFNIGTDTAGGWGVPTATDIAFALGILALLGNRIPNGVRVFLSTLAVADDIIAIIVIAIFYGQAPQISWLIAAGCVMALLVFMNKRHIYSLAPYIIGGIILWYCVFMSGVHSTIAGVLLAFAIPSGSRVNLHSFAAWSGENVDRANSVFQPEKPVLEQKEYLHTVQDLSKVAKQVVPPAARLEHRLYPWVYFLILPLFALTNADVSLAGSALGEVFADPAFLGVFLGLLLGKPLGILAFSFIVVKTGLAKLPDQTTWAHLAGAAVLGGVGFTMAIFVANLAFASEAAVTAAKIGILSASALAGGIGLVLLTIQARRSAREEH